MCRRIPRTEVRGTDSDLKSSGLHQLARLALGYGCKKTDCEGA